MSLTSSFCRCIKKVRKTVKVRKGTPRTARGKEQAAIAICVKSVLQTRGKTLRKFRCTGKRRPFLSTQPPLKH